MKSFKLFAALAIIGISWGATVPMIKLAVSTGHKPLGLILWELIISIVVLGGICLFRRIKPAIHKPALVFYLVVSFLGTMLPNSFSFVAAAQLPAGVMGIIIASVPMFSLLVALGLRSEKFSILRMTGVFFGIGAITLLIGPDTSLPDSSKAVFVLIALIAPFCYGLESNYVDIQTPADVGPVMALFGASVIGVLISAPLVWITDTWVDLRPPWGIAEQALIASSLIHALVYSGYIWLVGVSGAVFATQVAYIVTISGVFFSAYFLHESYSGWIWGSLLLMICGLVLVRPRDSSFTKSTPEQAQS